MSAAFRAVHAAAALALLAAPALAQLADLQPGRNFTAIPNFGIGRTENIDVGDCDNDGDLDVGTANGHDGPPPQLARLFINDGRANFTDETGTRFAGFAPMLSRDIEFVDFESDGDLDVFIANHTQGMASTGDVSRFWVNLGGEQLGAVGFYADETATRWGTLAGVPASSQLCGGCNSGPFLDFSCDCDFADLDDDADLDLFFNSYGPGMNGTRDSRVFLNDGAGVFNELWPWANHAADTKTQSRDVDLADFDGDFDLDVFMSNRDSQPRVYLNNLYGPPAGSAFTDTTQEALLDTGATQIGAANYEVEYADVDGDVDFDAWLINYNGNLERLLRNNSVGLGAAPFSFTTMNSWIANDPNTDENEVDFGDFDADGDLDSFIANFSGTNTLYASNLSQGGQGGGLYHRTGPATSQYPNPELPSNFNSGTSLDGEIGDMDGDGDLDLLLSNDGNQGNWLFQNILGVPDTHAPGVPLVTDQADKPNGSPTVIHAGARDNTPFYIHQFYAAELVYTVDGGAPASVPMFAQGGQQYRGVIPEQTDAIVEYHVEVTDLEGNTGVSASFTFEQGAGDAWTDLGSGLAGIAGIPALAGTGPLTPGSAGTLTLSGAAPSSPCALFASLVGTSAPFKCGTLVPVPVALQLVLATNGAGGLPLGWASWPSGLSGSSLYLQYAIADGAAVCGTALSNALRADSP